MKTPHKSQNWPWLCRWTWLSQAAVHSWWKWLSQAAMRCLRNNVAFHKSIPFITALLFSHSLIEKGAIQFLVVYVADLWTGDVRLVVILSIIQAGLSQAMGLVLDAVSEKWTGPFRMVVISTVFYTAGMWLLYLSTKFSNVVLLFILAILPTAIGVGGRDPTLRAFIRDQMKELEEEEQGDNMMNEKRKRVENRMEFWIRIGKILGSLAAFLWFGDMWWSDLFKFSAIVIMVSGFLFACGFPCYKCEGASGSAFGGVFWVIIAAIRRLGLPYPDSSEQFYQNPEKEIVLWPQFRCLRWVDRAAIITSPPREFPVAKVKAAKFLLAMTPLWASLFISSLGEAAGSHFFYLQADEMKYSIKGFNIPFAYLTVTQSFSSGTAILAFGPIINKLWKHRSNTLPWKLKLGLGLFCFFLSCIAAWLVETHRIDLFEDRKLVRDEREERYVVDMSILWITPQFWLLGFSRGFYEDGLKDFGDDQAVGNNLQFLGWASPWGTFAGIAWILAFQSWLHERINKSRLKDYYVGVAILCFVNLLFYLWTCNLSIFDTTKGREGSHSSPRAEEPVEGVTGELRENTPSAEEKSIIDLIKSIIKCFCENPS